MKNIILLLPFILMIQSAIADTTAPASPSSTPTETASINGTNASGQFEVMDISGAISGDPIFTPDAARGSWSKACDDWKRETKGLNKNNQMLAINCNQPSCITTDDGKTQCTSTGTYKIKTAGTRVNTTAVAPPLPEPPVAAPLPPQHEIAVAPPQTIVEIVPPARPGYFWIQGYWGWEGRRHVWFPGRWTVARPGYLWVGPRWEPYGHGWHFHEGYWHERR